MSIPIQQLKNKDNDDFYPLTVVAAISDYDGITADDVVETAGVIPTVTNPMIVSNAISTDKIQNSAITTTKLADKSVTKDKINYQSMSPVWSTCYSNSIDPDTFEWTSNMGRKYTVMRSSGGGQFSITSGAENVHFVRGAVALVSDTTGEVGVENVVKNSTIYSRVIGSQNSGEQHWAQELIYHTDPDCTYGPCAPVHGSRGAVITYEAVRLNGQTWHIHYTVGITGRLAFGGGDIEVTAMSLGAIPTLYQRHTSGGGSHQCRCYFEILEIA